MAAFISVQLKKTSEVDLAKPLVKFIQQTYPSGGEEQAQYCRAAEELSKLRRAALGRPLDKHEGALETLLRWAWGRRGAAGGGLPLALLPSPSLTPSHARPGRPPHPGLARRVGVACIPSWLPAAVLRGPVDRPPGRNGPPRIPSLTSVTSFLHFFFFFEVGAVCETPPFFHFFVTAELCWPGWHFIAVIA